MLTRITATKNKAVWQYEAEIEIDALADAVRARFATPGKHAIYADKREEAIRYLATVKGNSPPNLADYPYLSAEIGITGATAADVAQVWIARDRQWKQVAAQIEKATIAAKARIREARSQSQIQDILDQVTLAVDSFGDKPPQRPGAGKKTKKDNT